MRCVDCTRLRSPSDATNSAEFSGREDYGQDTSQKQPKSQTRYCDLCTVDLFKTCLSGTHALTKQMKLYIATPFCPLSGTNKYVDCNSIGITEIKKQGVQTHGGDLF